MPAVVAELETETRKPRGAPGNPAWRKINGKGRSGNPGGQRKLPYTLRELAIAKTQRAVSVLISAMESRDCPWPTKVRAAEIIIEHGHGKAAITVDPTASAAIGSSFAMLLDQVAREHQSQVEPRQLIDVTPQSVTTDEPAK